jgi:plastocyanin
MTTRQMLWGAALVLVGGVTTIQAHHSFSMFDNTKEEVLVGDVVRWAFNSPHTILYVKDAKGATWGFEGAAPPAIVGRSPSITGFTFKPGDRLTLIHCPLGDGRPGGAIGFVVAKDGTWYNPADGGCRLNEDNWKKWLASGFTSKAQAEAAAKK